MIRNFRHLLVFVDVFPEWMEAYPSWTEGEKTYEMVKVFFKESMPWFV